MPTTQRIDLRLYYEPTCDKIWFADSSGKLGSTDLEPWEFASRQLCDTETVRLLGLPSNAPLIVWLYQSRLQHGHPYRVQIGTPAVCNKQHLVDPIRAIFQMQEVDGLPGSKGGWRSVTKHDFAAALLQCAFQEKAFDNLEEILESHPAWAAISFIPTMDLFESARLLAEIGDPRWFVDPDKPDRYSRLRSYLGLTQRNIRFVNGWDHEGHGPGHNAERCRIVYKAMFGSSDPRHVSETDPQDFLRKKVRHYHDKNKKLPDCTVAILRAMNMYVNFIRLVWLETATPHGGEIFAPDHFFQLDDGRDQSRILNAWKTHVAALHR